MRSPPAVPAGTAAGRQGVCRNRPVQGLRPLFVGLFHLSGPAAGWSRCRYPKLYEAALGQ